MIAAHCPSCGVRSELIAPFGWCYACTSWTFGYERLTSPDPEVFFNLIVAIVIRAKMDRVHSTEVPTECACGRDTTECACEFVDRITQALDDGLSAGVVAEGLGHLIFDAAIDRMLVEVTA